MPECSGALHHRVGYGRFWTSAGSPGTELAARLPMAVPAKRCTCQTYLRQDALIEMLTQTRQKDRRRPVSHHYA